MTVTLAVPVSPWPSVQVSVIVCAPGESVRENDAPVPMSPSRLERQRADVEMLPCSGSEHDPAKFTGPVNDAPLLGDVIVYCRSEALKYGIPLEAVLQIIMDSNASKLGADGKPIYDANGKFLKGPNYWKPEPKIRELLGSS